jgi:mono/diheme cytochrome c family protein
MKCLQLGFATVFGFWAFAQALGQDTAPDKDQFDARIRPFLVKHCQECHSGQKPKGDLRLDRLPPDFAESANRERWLNVAKRVRAGEMPPKAKPRPPEKEIEAIAGWVNSKVEAAAAKRAAEGRVVLRRLNRVEYENTVRDLLGIEIELKELLPLDTSAHGFDNIGEALHTSSFLMDRYLEAADAALNVAIANGKQPPLVKKRYTLKDERIVKISEESVYRHRDDALVMFSSSQWNAITVGQFYPPDRGKYRIRISAYGLQSSGKPVTFRVDGGPMLMGTKNHLVGYFDAAPDKPTLVEFVDHFEARNHIRISPYGLANAQMVHKIGADKYEGAGLAVQWVEVEGPLHDTWPPECHRRIFGDLEQKPAPNYRVEVVSKNPEADAGRILRDFTRRAFRRTVTDQDVQPFVDLVKKKLAEKQSFEQAVRVGLKAVMVSPEFLFFREKPGKLDDFALASRLSYFLWSTMPDDELLAVAGLGGLTDPGTLSAQVERMLKHPKAAAFTENFLGQWLSLRDIDFTSPDFRLYPEFDEMLKEAMVRETHLFFDELLKNDLSLTNLVACDFTFLNERLAKHYGIPGVEGLRMRKVMLPAESHRGGVLTMGSVLKVTANGTNTSPVTRGAWVLDRILGTPPSPPPSGVSAVEPDIRGATTIREQLARHRQIASCAMCHSKIDPAGFALESFDVIGGWRENYRSVGNGKPVTIKGRRMPYLEGRKVDPADALPDGRKFKNIDELKQLLLSDKNQLARALATHLLTYATGAAPTDADRQQIEAIVKRVREKDYGFRTLVHEIVQSKLFQSK